MSAGPLRARSYTPSVDVGMRCVEEICDGEMTRAEVGGIEAKAIRHIAPLGVRWEEWLHGITCGLLALRLNVQRAPGDTEWAKTCGH